MKYISRLLLVTFLTFLLPCGSIFTVASELKTEYTFSDLQELKDGKWFSSAIKGVSAQYWPYNANNINAYLDNDTNLTAWNTKLTSDSTFQITGDTYISHQFTRPILFYKSF